MRLTLTLMALVLTAAPAAAQLVLLEEDEYDVAADGRLVTGGDLDGDGDRDLVTLSIDVATSAATARVWINDGAGELTAGADYAVLPAVASAVLVDVDSDDRLDLLVSAPGVAGVTPGGVQVLLGDGAGGFGATISELIAGKPGTPAVADIDADGDPDLALPTPAIMAVATLTGTGTGAFGLPTVLNVATVPVAVALPDMQLDGDPDLLVLHNSAPAATVTRRFGGPGASFGAPTSYDTAPALQGASALLVAPLDADAYPDALVYGGTYVEVLLRGDGAGGLLPGAVPFEGPQHPKGLHAVDLDFDGDLDVLQSSSWDAVGPAYNSFGVGVLISDGLGGLVPGVSTLACVAADDSFVGDLDGDLLPDVAAMLSDDRLAVRRGNGLGTFRDVPTTTIGPFYGNASLADFDEDGRPDVVVCRNPEGASGKIFHLTNDGLGGLLPPVELPLPLDDYGSCTAAADIDADGHLDMVLGNPEQSDILVLPGDGAGGFQPPVPTHAGTDTDAVVPADMNGDGWPDVVSVGLFDHAVFVLRNNAGSLLPGIPTSVPPFPVAMAVGDIDGDADPDAVVASKVVAVYALLRGNGSGGWLPEVDLPAVAVDSQALALGDLDGDGFDDLVSVWQAFLQPQATLEVRLADGAGSLLPPTSQAFPPSPACVRLLDLDVDGTLDAVVGRGLQSTATLASLTLLRGDGQGGFAPPESHFPGMETVDMLAGDMDGDGLVDLVSLSGWFQAAHVVLNLADDVWPWTQLGSSLPGATSPQLAGAGLLVEGTPGHLTLFDAPPFALAALFVSASSSPVPFKGGTLVPVPPLVTQLVVVPGDGRLHLPWSAWPATASGLSFYVQAAVVDAGAPSGVALSGAVRGVTP